MKLRLAHAVGARRRRPPARPVATCATPATTSPSAPSPATATSRRRTLLAEQVPAAGPRRRAWSATPRCATGAPSAARSPTATPPPTCPRACWPWAARSWPAGPAASARSPATDFFTGFLETALAPDELLTEIRRAQGARRRVVVPEVQPAGPGLGHRRRGRRRRRRPPGVALVNMGVTPLRAGGRRAGPRRWGRRPADAAQLAADEGTEPPVDLNASRRSTARHLAAGAGAPRPRGSRASRCWPPRRGGAGATVRAMGGPGVLARAAGGRATCRPARPGTAPSSVSRSSWPAPSRRGRTSACATPPAAS